ncbi:MAG TPA: hypothetical protein LFW10_00740 [Rickettsia endosymbiont of Diachasma alloeum]|nr:hypothetical protein [Rickettsia endosymbiont of Diachasma alloeum]
MDYNQIEQGLISSIAEDDPHKVSKQLQIKQWTHLYGGKLLRFSLSRTLNFVKQIISDEDCWYAVDSLEGVKLDRYEVGRKLLAATTPSGEDNPFNNMQKYKVACWCCFEDEIRELWAEAQSNFVREKPIVRQLDSTYAGHGPLVTYWTHYITGYMDKFKAKLQLTGDNNDLHGFESAVRGKHAEALEYFWDKLVPVLSGEEKDDLLIYTATYNDFFVGRANSDMVTFAMDHLDESKYHELLEKDFAKNKHYSSLSELTSNYLFDRAEKLFKCLSSVDIIHDDYSTSIYWVLYNILSVPNDVQCIGCGYQMLSTMWNMDGFEEHKQFFMHRLGYGDPASDKIGHLVKAGRTSDILSEIVSSLNMEQVENLKKSTSWAYEIFKSAHLFNDDVMKNLVATEQESVNILDKQEDMLVLGDSASIDNQELDSA